MNDDDGESTEAGGPVSPIRAALASLRKPTAVQAAEIRVTGLRKRLGEASTTYRKTCIADNNAGATTELKTLKDQRSEVETLDAAVNKAMVELGATRARFDPAFRAKIDPLSSATILDLAARADAIAADVADLIAAQDYAARNGLTVPLALERAGHIHYAVQLLQMALRGARPQ